jgi:putative transposase
MSENKAYLIPDKFYHIYNHGNGKDNLFYNEENYIYFLKKYKEYISPVADTYAYCLMPNHFHFLIQIKSAEAIFKFLKQNNKLPEQNMTLEEFELLFANNPDINLFSLHVSKQFSNLFNGYSQAINKQEGRKGSMFIRSFKRKEIASSDYLRSLILYIHLNPVNHQFVKTLLEWKYISYHSIISNMETNLKRNEVIELFNDLDNFKYSHRDVNQNLLNELEANLN